MNFEDLNIGLAGVQFIISIVVGVYAWFIKRESATSGEVNKLKEQLSEQKEQFSRLEERVASLPDHAMFTKLSGDMQEVKANLKSMNEGMGGVSRQIELLNSYLLNRSRE